MTLAGFGIGAGLALLQTPQYEASAKCYVSVQSVSSASDLNQGASYTQQIVKSFADVATTPFILRPVMVNLGLKSSEPVLATHVTANAPLDTVVVEIQATDGSARTAAEIANEVVKVLIARAGSLSPASSTGTAAVKLVQIEQAIPPESPISPRVVEYLLVGAVVGFGLAALGLVGRDSLDGKVTMADLEGLDGVAVLGGTRFETMTSEHPLVVADNPTALQSESYRSIALNLKFVGLGEDKKSVVVTSCVPGEGKSTVACNLALALQAIGQTVILVDADLRRPSVARYLGLDGSVGLTDVVIGTVTASQAIQAWGPSSLPVLPAGRVPPNPIDVLQSDPFLALMASTRELYDFVIVDAPPLLPVLDAAVLAREASGALFVVSASGVKRSQVRHALSSLNRADARVLGSVLTKARNGRANGSYGGYYAYGPNLMSEA